MIIFAFANKNFMLTHIRIKRNAKYTTHKKL